MRGNFLNVWNETWTLVWRHIQVDHEEMPGDVAVALAGLELPDDFDQIEDLFSALYVEAYKAFRPALRGIPDENTRTVKKDENYAFAEAIDIGAISNDFPRAETEFAVIRANFFDSEYSLVQFLENAYHVIEEFDGRVAARYRSLLRSFVEKFSLRYEVRDPCELCPTLPGLFASLVRGMKAMCQTDPHLNELFSDFEEAIMDLRARSSAGKIRTCMVKQVNLLEAIAARHPDTSRNTIGAICSDLRSWPHDSLCESMKALYKFTCDYPGIRHGGTPGNRRRDIDMRDLLSVSIMLFGFAPYLSNDIDATAIYQGSS
jgi:hypothetical protein